MDPLTRPLTGGVQFMSKWNTFLLYVWPFSQTSLCDKLGKNLISRSHLTGRKRIYMMQCFGWSSQEASCQPKAFIIFCYSSRLTSQDLMYVIYEITEIVTWLSVVSETSCKKTFRLQAKKIWNNTHRPLAKEHRQASWRTIEEYLCFQTQGLCFHKLVWMIE